MLLHLQRLFSKWQSPLTWSRHTNTGHPDLEKSGVAWHHPACGVCLPAYCIVSRRHTGRSCPYSATENCAGSAAWQQEQQRATQKFIPALLSGLCIVYFTIVAGVAGTNLTGFGLKDNMVTNIRQWLWHNGTFKTEEPKMAIIKGKQSLNSEWKLLENRMALCVYRLYLFRLFNSPTCYHQLCP